jgi:hypothetical protein
MKHRILFLLFLIPIGVNGQTYNAFVKAGENALAKGDMYEAYNHFNTAIQIDSTDAQLWGKLAKAAYGFNLLDVADYYYCKIEKEGRATEIYGFEEDWLQVKMSIGDYDAALEIALKYNARKYINPIKSAIQLKSDSIKVDIQHLTPINTRYSDYAAQKVGEDLYYSSHRFKVINQKQQKDYISKLIVAENFDNPLPLRYRFNTNDKSTANAFFVSANEVYYTICESVNGKQQCQIYHRKKEGDVWQKAEQLPATINKKGCTNTHPTIAFDSIDNKRYLYFVSDRSGKMTIWRSEQLQQEWDDPTELLFLEDETATQNITPFFDNETQTLYFSSDRTGGLGNLDVYKVQRVKEGWSSVENLGYPLNSSYNDIYFRLNDDSKTGYFSSNRKGSMSLTKEACCFDIYAFELLDETPEQPLTPLDTIVFVEVSTTTRVEIPTTEIPVTPLEELSQFLPLALYFHNDEPNPRTWKKTTTVSYSTAYHEYYARKFEYIQAFSDLDLKDENEDDAEEITAFFEEAIKSGHDNLVAFSEVLLKHLQAGETVEIVLKGFASPRAKSDYNLNLSQRRVICVQNHFHTYRNGIFKPYFNNEQLIISDLPFGETKAAASVSDNISDKRNSIYSVEAARERRVEIVEVR